MTNVAGTFDMVELEAELSVDEGCEANLYFDTVGLPTVGIGHNLKGRPLTYAEISLIFQTDVGLCCDVMDKNIPWWRHLPPPQQRVMIELCFMGWGSFSKFGTFFQKMEAHDWDGAAADLQTTAWYKQVGTRGPRTVHRLLGTALT